MEVGLGHMLVGLEELDNHKAVDYSTSSAGLTALGTERSILVLLWRRGTVGLRRAMTIVRT